MQLERFTIKAQEALQGAQSIAQRFGHTDIDTEHLALALLEQSDGIVSPLLQKLGLSPAALTGDVQSELERRPRVTGGTETFLSPALKRVLDGAHGEAAKL